MSGLSPKHFRIKEIHLVDSFFIHSSLSPYITFNTLYDDFGILMDMAYILGQIDETWIDRCNPF